MTSVRFLPLTSSMSPFSASQPRRMLFLASFPSGIFLASQPISFIWLFIIFMSNIRRTRSCTVLSKLDSTSGWSSFFVPFPFFSVFSSSLLSPASQFISTSLYPPPSLSRNFRPQYRMARSGEAQGISARWPSTPTLPQRVKKTMWLGFDSFWRIWRMQNLLLLFWMLDWLSVLAQVTPMCTSTLKVACCEKYWSTGTLPFRITFFISFSSFAAYLAGCLAGYLAAGLGGLSSFLEVLEAERSLLVFLGSVFDFLRPLLSASSALIFLDGDSSLSAALSSCLPRVRVLISDSGGAGLSSFFSSLAALLRVFAFGGIPTALYFIRIFIILQFMVRHICHQFGHSEMAGLTQKITHCVCQSINQTQISSQHAQMGSQQ